MSKMDLFKLLSGVGTAAILTACATTESNVHTRANLRTASDLSQVAAQPAPAANVSPVQVHAANYVAADVTRARNGDPLPAKWQRESVSVTRAAGSSFQDVASAITQATGIPVAVSTATGGQSSASVAAPQQGGGLATGPLPAGFPMADALQQISAGQATVTASTSGGADLGVVGTMRLNYSGKLSGLLDLVAANYNLHWEFKNNRLLFSKTVSRVFDVPALPIIQDLSFSMSSGSSTTGDGATSNGSQSASTRGGFDLWSDLQNAIGSIVGTEGRFEMAAQTGQIIVNASPAAVDRVADYVRQLNQQLNKQVAISVKVYSVAINDNDSQEASVQALLGNLNFGGTSGPGGLGWAIANPNTRNSMALEALASRSDVSTVTSASVTALNNTPVPVQVANTRGFAQQVNVTATETTVTSSITPGTVTTGFNLHLVPKILDDGSTQLQYGMNISELVGADDGFDIFESNGSRVQLPNISQRNFIQQARIPNGSTLVLAGFEQVRASNTSKGPGHPGAWLFGGSRAAAMSREILVIAITPVVLDISPAAMAAATY